MRRAAKFVGLARSRAGAGRAAALVLTLALLGGACGDAATGVVGADVTVGADGAGLDVRADTVVDIGPDTAPDAAPDTVVDTAPDTVADSVGDTDTAQDTVADSVGDADTAPDTVADSVGDTAQDTVADSVGDTAPDTVADTVADTGPDTVEPPLSDCGLLANGGAEAGGLAGWTSLQGSFAVLDGGVGQPDPFAGGYFFGAGNDGTSVLSQTVDMAPWAGEVAAGGVWATVGAYVRDWSGKDRALMTVRALGADGAALAELTGGPWTADSWTWRSLSLLVPAGTAALEVRLRGERDSGLDNDAYFDDVSLCLTETPPAASVEDLPAPPYLMWVTQHEVTVLWETATPAIGRVEFGPTTALGGELVEPAAVTHHEVRLSDLPAGAVTYYRISWGGAPSDIWSFRTAPPDAAPSEPFTFIAWGDNQDGVDVFKGIVAQMLDYDPAFAVSVGDIVQDGSRDNFRHQFAGPVSPAGREMPFLVARGNHPMYGDAASGGHWHEYVAAPGDELCYGWSWGPLYFQVVDTERGYDEQEQCVIDGLTSQAALDATFRIGLFHKPPRVNYWYGGKLAFTNAMEAPWVREQLEPLLETLDVDFVINGHNHLYNYTPETPGGITWVTTGGAGGSIDTDNFLWKVGDWPEITVEIHKHHFLVIDVDGAVMHVRAIGTDGQEIHSFDVVADTP